ncbi:MAG: hypothetical protein HGA74_15885 [Deltaproteobacteria bacterium]|nr:hypothetical protein [Deltaproteobacteria bacterium]
MNARDLIKAGRLHDARKQLTDEVKGSPGNLPSRVLLFQVLCFLGEWDRARRHLDVIVTQDSRSETGVQVYRNLIDAEEQRSKVMTFSLRPRCLPGSPPYLDAYLTACASLSERNLATAGELFAKLESERPILDGTADGRHFSGFRDTDAILSLFLEAIVIEGYVWIPVDTIRELSISPPKTLFDLLWIPTRIKTWQDIGISCFLPVLYPNSFSHEDDRVKLGRMTDWFPLGDSFLRGAGQHVFKMGDEERALLEMREVVFSPSEDKKGS